MPNAIPAMGGNLGGYLYRTLFLGKKKGELKKTRYHGATRGVSSSENSPEL